MIYIVEVLAGNRAHAWFAFGADDFLRKVYATKQCSGWTIFKSTTPRQLLNETGDSPDSPGSAEAALGVFDLAKRYGWDSILYRADYLLGQAVYQSEAVDEFNACLAAVTRGLDAYRVYFSDEEAVAALHRDPLYEGRAGLCAHIALREQLIAQEAMADDL